MRRVGVSIGVGLIRLYRIVFAWLPSGCGFRPRCSYADAGCGAAVPGLGFIAKSHQVACLKVDAR